MPFQNETVLRHPKELLLGTIISKVQLSLGSIVSLGISMGSKKIILLFASHSLLLGYATELSFLLTRRNMLSSQLYLLLSLWDLRLYKLRKKENPGGFSAVIDIENLDSSANQPTPTNAAPTPLCSSVGLFS